jgi:hypothetical protein
MALALKADHFRNGSSAVLPGENGSQEQLNLPSTIATNSSNAGVF